jgi:trans-AT polyketide synthase/acyltransferase/oxidoreductase domain-containing protein
MLQEMEVNDTDYCPAGDMFEHGSKVQVVKRGVLFPARANRLFELYRQYNSLEEIDEKIIKQIESRYFMKNLKEIYQECKNYYQPEYIKFAESNPKQKMAAIFKWYFWNASHLALKGEKNYSENFQIFCGPALGAFNQYVKNTYFENWENRHVDEIGIMLMEKAAELLSMKFIDFTSKLNNTLN